MKKLLYMAVAAIAALSSCSSEDIINGNGNENENGNANAPVFTATIEGNGATRTQLVPGSAGNLTKVNWLGSDKVFISTFFNNTTPVYIGNYNVTPDNSDASTATLAAYGDALYNLNIGEANAHREVFAIYPASYATLAENTKTEISTMHYVVNTLLHEAACKLTLPDVQRYRGSNLSDIAPMMAYRNEGDVLQFKNVTALLAISVPASQMGEVKEITVTADKEISGKFVVHYDQENWPMEYQASGTKSITLRNYLYPVENVSIPSGKSKTFYVSIPPQTYGSLKIDVTDGTNTISKTTTAASITVERNKIYPINFGDCPKSIYVGSELLFNTINVGESTQLNVDISPYGAIKSLTWSSSNPSVATVSADGVVKGLKDGTTTITATAADGSGVSGSYTLQVQDPSMVTTGTAKATINGKQVDVPWVQLWPGGPKWACYNVGATVFDYTKITEGIASDFDDSESDASDAYLGGLYCWGGSTNRPTSFDGYTGKTNLPSNYDTATRVWGENWRTPTKEEFEALMSKCFAHAITWDTPETPFSDKNYIEGILFFGGSGNHSENMLFFPTTGSWDGSGFDRRTMNVSYWTSTYSKEVTEPGTPYSLAYFWSNWYDGGISWSESDPNQGIPVMDGDYGLICDDNDYFLSYAVRAVLNE